MREAWARMLRAAAMLGLSPECFWRLGVREWRALTARDADALRRTEFEALRRAFPDEPR
ncbi:MAG: phage tail assembly chaperone [Hyphomonadaceae bacterium]